jgi:peptidoglycan/xylan/chitin deacetylase (PgdA/CDA1 family)
VQHVQERDHADGLFNGHATTVAADYAAPVPRDRLVLCYHAISPTWPAALATTAERFAAQLRHLARRGYAGATFTDLVEGRVPGKAVAVTFDDGFRSVATLGRPVLDAAGWPATIFVPTDFPGDARPLAWEGTDRWQRTEHEAELASLGWEELRTLAAAGWEIGSHTCSHPHLTRLGDAALADELARSREAVSTEIGSCRSLAYPYGDADERVVAAAGTAGYEAAALLSLARSPRPLAWPRVGVYHVDDGRRFALKASRLARAVQPRLRRPRRA